MSAGETITLAQGAQWCENFRDEFPLEVKAFHYSKNIIESVLNQSGCTGIRIYNALNEDKDRCVVIVGVDSNGNDLTQGHILDRGEKCPPICPSDSPLNRKN